MTDSTRRSFMMAPLAAAGASQGLEAPRNRFIKSICRNIFPKQMPLADCFRAVKSAGFDAMEVPMEGELGPSATPDEVKRLGEAARRAKVGIAALWVEPLGQNPLNSPDAAVRARGVEALGKAVEFAGYLDCGALLVVPARVGPLKGELIGYQTTWERCTAELKKAVARAERGQVVMGIENVSNRFLLSPLEMRSFVDQFRSPWLQAFFDVGNVMYNGYPEDWILTLGRRIARVHLKGRKSSPKAEIANPSGLLDGDVNWKSVMAALVKVGYRGPISPEIGYDPRDPNQLAKVSQALDKILAMA